MSLLFSMGSSAPPPSAPTLSGVGGFADFTSGGGNNAQVTLTLTSGRGLRAIAVGQAHGSYTVSDDQGNTWTKVGTDIAVVQDIYDITLTEWVCANNAVSGIVTVSVTGPGGCGPSIRVDEFSGPVSVDATQNTTETGASPYDAALTTVATNTLVMLGITPWCATGYGVTSSGYTSIANNGDPAVNWPVANLYKTRSSAGAENPSIAVSGNVGGTNVPIKLTSYKV